jgi:hypothetical protein
MARLFILLCYLLLSACGGGDSATAPTTVPETVTSGIGIGTGTGIPTGTGTAIISGRVSGETSNLPLQGAVVKVYYASDIDPSNNSVLTDVNGRYNLTVNENVDLSLQFSATDYATINSERGQIVGNVSGADLPMSTTMEAQQMIDAIFAGPDYRSYGWVLVNTEASDGSELLGVSINSSVTPDPSRNPNPVYVNCELYPAPNDVMVTSGGDFISTDITVPCTDDRPFMYAAAYGPPSTQNVTISTSFDSDVATIRTGEFTIVDLEQSDPTRVTPAAFLGTWKSLCFLDDDDPLDQFYSVITLTINASTANALIDMYDLSDANCLGASTQTTVNNFYRLGSDVTVNGTVAGITTATKIDFTETAPPNEVDYTIIAVKDNRLYFGNDDDPATDGTTDAKRPVQLEDVDFLTRQ